MVVISSSVPLLRQTEIILKVYPTSPFKKKALDFLKFSYFYWDSFLQEMKNDFITLNLPAESRKAWI